jgi:hypothetical protein
LPRPGAKSTRGRNGSDRQQWATAVVRRAMPRIVESLIEAAVYLDECRHVSPDRPNSHAAPDGEDESLAALLLRLLRAPESAEDSDVGAGQMSSASKNESVG